MALNPSCLLREIFSLDPLRLDFAHCRDKFPTHSIHSLLSFKYLCEKEIVSKERLCYCYKAKGSSDSAKEC